MAYGERESVRRVRAALGERGLAPEFVELERTARSAADAAEALGCRVGQIVKSLVFRGTETGRPVLVLASGPNRVDEGKVSVLAREPIEKADAAFVREKSGFAIGGVPPVGHVDPPVVFLDEDLMQEEVVWAAAGHTHVVFGLGPEELLNATGARVARVSGQAGASVRCSFRGTVLSSATTTGCSFEGCDFTDARLNGSGHRSSPFIYCSFEGAGLFSGEFEACRLIGAFLEEADLTAINPKGQDLRGVLLVGTELAGCDLTGADLRDADRRGADLPVLDLTEVKLDVGQAIQVARCLGAEVDLEG